MRRSRLRRPPRRSPCGGGARPQVARSHQPPTSPDGPPRRLLTCRIPESDEEEFFDAVDAGEVAVDVMPPSDVVPSQDGQQSLVISDGLDLSDSFHGYENGIRKRLKMAADDRPKISLWVR